MTRIHQRPLRYAGNLKGVLLGGGAKTFQHADCKVLGENLMPLLGPGEQQIFEVVNPNARSRLLLTADHAGRAIPQALGTLGLGAADLARHIAWDIGIAGVTKALAGALDATAVLQVYSRLVVDCNRKPTVDSAFPAMSEATAIPGNAGLSQADRDMRVAEIFTPYHAAIKRQLAARGGRAVYVAMHSFTPIYLGIKRPMQIALLYNRNKRLSGIFGGLLRAEPGLVVADNEPYQVSDETDYGVPVHAEAAGLDYVEIEIRQDLIATPQGQLEWSALLARLLPAALEILENGDA